MLPAWSVINRAKLSHQEVANVLGVSRMTVWKWAHGKGEPDDNNKIAVEAFLTKLEAKINEGVFPLNMPDIRERVCAERERLIRIALS